MWLVIRSLRFKLTIIYVLAILIIMMVAVTYIEHYNNDVAVSTAARDTEGGPAFINGAMPDPTEASAIYSNNPDSPYGLNGSDFENHMSRFKPFIETSIEGGVGVGWSGIKPLVTIHNEEYYSITFNVTVKKTGVSYQVPLTFSKNLFPYTIPPTFDVNKTVQE